MGEAEPVSVDAGRSCERLRLRNRVMDLNRAARWLNRLGQATGLAKDDAYRIDLVIAEALGNVVFYAYSGHSEQAVELLWCSDFDASSGNACTSVTLELRDQGAPFDPLHHQAVQPAARLEDAVPGGMGIVLMRSFSDRMSYHRDGSYNVLTISFTMRGQETPLLSALDSPATDDDVSIGALDHIARCPLFEGLQRGALEQLMTECPVRRLKRGEVLLSIGQINHHLYLVTAGELDICLEAPDSDITVSIPPGECVGELSIIDGKPASAYVVAAEDSELLVISDDLFWTRLGETPGLARNMLRVLTERIRSHNNELLRALEARLRFGQLGRDLALAADLQASMLPGDFEQLREDFPRADIFAVMESARDIGGDFYDVFAIDDNRICVAVGDVSGKGMPAALFMVRSMTLLRTQIRKKRRLTRSMERVNTLLCENNPTNMFVTLAVAVVDLDGRRVEWVNGGHNPPLLLRRNGKVASLTDAKGILLGVEPSARFTEGSAGFRPGDTLLLFTDGVTEARSAQDQLFGDQRLIKALAGKRRDGSAQSLVAELRRQVSDFAGSAPQSDDITLLAFRFERG